MKWNINVSAPCERRRVQSTHCSVRQHGNRSVEGWIIKGSTRFLGRGNGSHPPFQASPRGTSARRTAARVLRAGGAGQLPLNNHYMNNQSEAAGLVPVEVVERRIFLIRDQKVMISTDLAELYGVPPRVLVQAVKRNIERFPADFMFQLSREELAALRSTYSGRPSNISAAAEPVGEIWTMEASGKRL